jgi:integrase
MRFGEIKSLRWSFIDREKMMIRLPKEVTKEKRAKAIPINHHVKAVLDSLPRSILHDYVITYKGKPVNGKQNLRKQFPITCRKGGIPHGTKNNNGLIFHDLRRTVKTNMLFAGVDKAHRDAILGHSAKGMDLHYIVPTDESLTEALDRYTRWLDDQLGQQNIDHSVDQAQI